MINEWLIILYLILFFFIKIEFELKCWWYEFIKKIYIISNGFKTKDDTRKENSLEGNEITYFDNVSKLMH